MRGKEKVRLVTITQLANKMGITRQGLRKAIVEKRLRYKAYKLGNNWVVEVPA